jgi:hypothetical protein
MFSTQGRTTMNKKDFAFALLLGSLAAIPAIAPNTSTSIAATSSTTYLSEGQPGDWRASKLVGVHIYGPDDKSIGEVADVIISSDGSIKAIIISVGGFLGIGSKNVALPFNAIKWEDKPKNPLPAPPATMAPGTGPTAPDAGPTPPVTTIIPAPGTEPPLAAGPPPIHDYPDHGVLNATQDQLKQAPAYKYVSEK